MLEDKDCLVPNSSYK